MALLPGTQLGAYEIVAPIGAGGMGEVYRARDKRLKRDVAIKILPDVFASDPERLARFQREAELLATLNHPNIAQIYGIEERALVLELVEGPTLADRIAKGPLPLDEALPIARQIADALEAAHERGIIHRDFKPANVKVLADGTVKVLDFGLAKAIDPIASAASQSQAPAHVVSMSPTLTSPAMTMGGVILGTAAYMSPEQAKGKPVDKRSDIWAFGCVLYEMLTGGPLHSGETVSEVLASVIMKPANWSSLPEDTPAHVRRLLERCLDKDPRQRLRDIGEARVELTGDRPSEKSQPTVVHFSRRWLPIGVSVTAALATAAMFVLRPSTTTLPADDVRIFAVNAPPSAAFISPAPMLALSPDGRALVFVATDSQGRQMLWCRKFDTADAFVLKGTEGASDPFWAPDSRRVGFFASGKIMAVDVESGRLQSVADADLPVGAAWGGDGTIVFASASQDAQGVYRVSAAGGKVEPLMTEKTSAVHRAWRTPVFLPDYERFLYLAQERDKTGWQALLGDLRTGRSQYLFETESKVEYANPGWIFYQTNGRLVAQRFNLDSARVSGEPVALAQDLLGLAANGRKAFTVSAGLLAYRERPVGSRLIVLSRAGRQLEEVGRIGDQYPIAISPDNKWLAFRRNGNIWLTDLVTGDERRLTFAAGVMSPVWSPDGRFLAYAQGSFVSGNPKAWRVSADGSGAPQELFSAPGALSQWLPDNMGILFDSNKGAQLGTFDGKWRSAIENAQSLPREGQVSADGKWIAYASTERGDYQVYVQPFPEGAGRWQVSRNGGRQPRWRKDGTELYYIAADGHLTAAVLNTSHGFNVVSNERLFEFGASTGLPNNTGFWYDVTADGQRFVMSTELIDHIRAPITVVLNWRVLVER